MNTVNTNRMTICLLWPSFSSRPPALSLYHTSVISGQLLWPKHLLAARLSAIILMDRHSRYTLITPHSWHIVLDVSHYKWFRWKLKATVLLSSSSFNVRLTDSAGRKYLVRRDILFLLLQLFSQSSRPLAVTRWQAVSWPCSGTWFTHTVMRTCKGHMIIRHTHTGQANIEDTLAIMGKMHTNTDPNLCVWRFSPQATDQHHYQLPIPNTRECGWHTSATVAT